MADIGEIVRLVIHYSQNHAGDMQNVFNFIISGAVVDDDDLLADLEDWVVLEWGPEWQDLANSAGTLESFEADIVTGAGLVARNIGGGVVGIAGTLSGDALPAAVAAHLLAYTAIPKTRGSKYIPCMGEAGGNYGAWTATVLADLAVLLVTYLTGYALTGGGTLVPGVVSRTSESFVPFLISGLIDTVAATQRRRKAGVGI